MMLKNPETLVEHHLKVERTARYYTLGSPDKSTEAWIVCHGYSQLAGSFIRYFEPLEGRGALVFAPEGLSRFYPNRFSNSPDEARKVGATWMTREDRLAEIEDYVNYLSRLARRVPQSLPLSALGFSQGCATVCRWVAASSPGIEKLVLWGGTLPPDLDESAFVKAMSGAVLKLVVGRNDEFISQAAIDREEARIRSLGLTYELVLFDGGHQLHRETLASI